MSWTFSVGPEGERLAESERITRGGLDRKNRLRAGCFPVLSFIDARSIKAGID
jgi:hypothetical protein